MYFLASATSSIFFGIMRANSTSEVGRYKEVMKDRRQVKGLNMFLENIDLKASLTKEKETVLGC